MIRIHADYMAADNTDNACRGFHGLHALNRGAWPAAALRAADATRAGAAGLSVSPSIRGIRGQS